MYMFMVLRVSVCVEDLQNRHTRRGPKCTNGVGVGGGGLHVVGGAWVSYPFFGVGLDAYKGPRPRGRVSVGRDRTTGSEGWGMLGQSFTVSTNIIKFHQSCCVCKLGGRA